MSKRRIKRRARCESCQFVTKLYHVDGSAKQRGERHPGFFVCALCRDSFANNALAYPNSDAYSFATLGTICHVANAIIAALGERK
jgi:hypothetical protein